MHVGILKPDWLAGARYKGVEDVEGHQCDVWAASSSMHHPFVTYFADVETQRPWRWIFFDGAIFDVSIFYYYLFIYLFIYVFIYLFISLTLQSCILYSQTLFFLTYINLEI